MLTSAGKPAVTAPPADLAASVNDMFARVTDVAGAAQLALWLEQVAASTYLFAIGNLQSPDAINLAGSIFPIDRQHISVLLFALGMYPVPETFANTQLAYTGGGAMPPGRRHPRRSSPGRASPSPASLRAAVRALTPMRTMTPVPVRHRALAVGPRRARRRSSSAPGAAAGPPVPTPRRPPAATSPPVTQPASPDAATDSSPSATAPPDAPAPSVAAGHRAADDHPAAAGRPVADARS